MTKLRSRVGTPSPAMLIAMLALMISLGGVAFAAAPAVKGLITRGKIADNAVNGAKVADNSLTGEDVRESSLSKVPDANNLDGRDSRAFGGITHAWEYASTAPVAIGGIYAKLVETPPLAGGAYSVVARTEAVNMDGQSHAITCQIKTSDGLVRDMAGHNLLSHYHLTLVAAFTLPDSGTIDVECNGAEGAEATAKMVVTRIDAAN